MKGVYIGTQLNYENYWIIRDEKISWLKIITMIRLRLDYIGLVFS